MAIDLPDQPYAAVASIPAPAVSDALLRRSSGCCCSSWRTRFRKQPSSATSSASSWCGPRKFKAGRSAPPSADELETAQREFGELAVFEEIRAAVFVSPDNQVRPEQSPRLDRSSARFGSHGSRRRRASARRRSDAACARQRTNRGAVQPRSRAADIHHAGGGADCARRARCDAGCADPAGSRSQSVEGDQSATAAAPVRGGGRGRVPGRGGARDQPAGARHAAHRASSRHDGALRSWRAARCR